MKNYAFRAILRAITYDPDGIVTPEMKKMHKFLEYRKWEL